MFCEVRLRPSEIFYTQDSINRIFGRCTNHSNVLIGRTLDDLCENRCRLSNIPTITVIRRDGKWFTDCNRRLWVFRHLERLGKCETVPVTKVTAVSPRKMSTSNGGTEISIRNGSPGGLWYIKPSTYNHLHIRRDQPEGNDDNQQELPTVDHVPDTPQESHDLNRGSDIQNTNITRRKRRKENVLPVTNQYFLRSTTLLGRHHPYNLRSRVRKQNRSK